MSVSGSPSLLVIDAAGRRIVPIDKPRILIGRRANADLQIVSVEVSREHAEIVENQGVHIVRDLGSRYGTFVNGEAVVERVLVEGDRIRLGRTDAVEIVFGKPTPAAEAALTSEEPSEQPHMTALKHGLDSLTSAHTLEDVLERVLDSAIEISSADRGFIMLASHEKRLELKAGRGRGKVTLSGNALQTSRRIPERVLATGYPVIVDDLLDSDAQSAAHEGTIALGVRHVLCTPLRLVRHVERPDQLPEEVIGVLYLDGRERRALRSSSHQSALDTLAAQAALVIENARLYSDVLARAERDKKPRIGGGTPLLTEGTPLTDDVYFSVSAPSSVVPGMQFIIDVWSHLHTDRSEVRRRASEAAADHEFRLREKGPVALARGTLLKLRIESPIDIEVSDPEDTILWNGEIGTASFLASIHERADQGSRHCTITVFIENVSVARVHFVITVAEAGGPVETLHTRTRHYRRAFASYANENRDDVMRVVQGLQKVAPDLDVFIDVAKLRSGQHWEDELWSVIPNQDVFYLFWSRAASGSAWVEKEWRCALQVRGLGYIDPAPLEPPDIAPPPEELRLLHFNDWTLAYRRRGMTVTPTEG